MKHKLIPGSIFLASLILAATSVLSAQVTQNKPKPPMQKGLPDLAFGIFKKLPNGDVEIAIVNQGAVKSVATEGMWTCKTPPAKPGEAQFSPNVGFPIKELPPGAQFKTKFTCGTQGVLSASLDTKNKNQESDEKNNSIKF